MGAKEMRSRVVTFAGGERYSIGCSWSWITQIVPKASQSGY